MNIRDIFESEVVMEKATQVGRPAKYETEEEMREKIIEYFEEGGTSVEMFVGGFKQTIKTYTITGLALYLGFYGRKALIEYAKKGEFGNSIKKAKSLIEQKYEEKLANGGGSGIIFALKNFDWKDIQTLEGEVNDNGEKKFKMEYVHSKYENIDENGEEIQENK